MERAELFYYASRKKYRFTSNKGLLSVEELWDLPLTSLNTIAKGINKELKQEEEEDFLKESTTQNTDLKRKLEILKVVIHIRQEENSAKLDAVKKAEKKQKLLKILEAKDEEKFQEMSEAEIKAELAKM